MEETQKKVEVSMQMTTAAMFEFSYWHSYHGFMGIVNYAFSFAALAALLAGYGKGNMVAMVALIILASLFTIINPLLLLKKSARQVKTSPMFQKPLTYTFDAQGFTVAQGEDAATASWTDVLLIRETKNLIILYMGASNATILLKKEIGEALSEVKTWIREANPDAAGKLKK